MDNNDNCAYIPWFSRTLKYVPYLVFSFLFHSYCTTRTTVTTRYSFRRRTRKLQMRDNAFFQPHFSRNSQQISFEILLKIVFVKMITTYKLCRCIELIRPLTSRDPNILEFFIFGEPEIGQETISLRRNNCVYIISNALNTYRWNDTCEFFSFNFL